MHSIHLQWYLQRYNEHNEFRKYRATDIAEREVMRAIHEIRTREPLCEELIAAHRDSSIYNGTLITQMPDTEMEQESWKRDRSKRRTDIPWSNIDNHKVYFEFDISRLPLRALIFAGHLSSCYVFGNTEVQSRVYWQIRFLVDSA